VRRAPTGDCARRPASLCSYAAALPDDGAGPPTMSAAGWHGAAEDSAGPAGPSGIAAVIGAAICHLGLATRARRQRGPEQPESQSRARERTECDDPDTRLRPVRRGDKRRGRPRYTVGSSLIAVTPGFCGADGSFAPLLFRPGQGSDLKRPGVPRWSMSPPSVLCESGQYMSGARGRTAAKVLSSSVEIVQVKAIVAGRRPGEPPGLSAAPGGHWAACWRDGREVPA
jgi:hypothetical protein